MPLWLRGELDEFEVYTVDYAGLKGKKDEELFETIDGRFDALVTFDRSMVSQQAIGKRKFSVIVLVVTRQTPGRILALLPELKRILKLAKPGRSYELGER